MRAMRTLATACMLIEIAACAYVGYLLLFTPAFFLVPRGIMQFDLVFLWLLPLVEVLLGYFDLTRQFVPSGRRKLGWGVAIAIFGCILLVVIRGRLDFFVRGELMRAVPVHIVLPLVMWVLTRSATGAPNRIAGETAGSVSPSLLGRVVVNVALSAAVMGIGIYLTALLIKSDIFSNSVIFIGFLPIPGMVLVATPIVPAILGVFYIWEHNK